MQSVPENRIQAINRTLARPDGDFVLYWMTAFRRLHSNFALQRAVEWSETLRKPLVVLEAVRCQYRWASDRFTQFIVDGMIDNQAVTATTNAHYAAYIEPATHDGSGLMETFASHACVIVTDDFPCFFHPAMYARIARNWPCSVELVDSNGILPMRAVDRTFTVAHSYRRFMQKEVHKSMPVFPVHSPLDGLSVPKLKSLPKEITSRWKFQSEKELKSLSLARLPIDHSVAPVADRGGHKAATKRLNHFVDVRLAEYAEARNEPEQSGSSSLSAHLHFGHISAHEIFDRLTKSADWSHERLSPPNGSSEGFWNLGTNIEAFMDQLMTWREIGFNMCSHDSKYDRYESLPDWAQLTLEQHSVDPRPYVYSLDEFERALTHDELWNAAQRQLVREGRMHNYLRMLWGKKILHWTQTPRDALAVMIELNNKYALDGRDPNSYSGIFWVLGRYDRAWGPERPIFGKIRYMTSESTRSKYSVKRYIQQYSE